MAEPVVLAFQEMMQRRRCPIGGEPARNDVGTSADALEFALERRRLAAIGMTQAAVARCEIENVFTRRTLFGAGFLDDGS